MSKAAGSPEHDPLSAYRASEPRRARDPFANPALRSEIARIAEARAQRAASGWRSVLFGWVSAAPRGALAGAALLPLAASPSRAQGKFPDKPIRLVVPWKYGFKGIKSIVKITLTEQEPPSTWNKLQPSEYGFYANVNPAVDHPRWSQATERRIGEADGLFGGARIDTLPFNGYADEVASLYDGMDLTKFF